MRRLLSTLFTLCALLGASLAAVPAASAAYPGADGRIAFVRANQIYTVSADGSGIRQLTFAPTAKSYRPKYSPDGARIAFLRETVAGDKDIWVMRANGSHKRQVTDTGTVTSNPTWSPDGAWIAFGSPLQKVKSTAPFGEPIQLRGQLQGNDSSQPLRVVSSVAWSPDARHIAYYSDQAGREQGADHFIQIYDAVSHLVDTWYDVGNACCGEGYFADLAWGPGGGRLAYTDGKYSPEDTGGVQPPPIITIDPYPIFTPFAFASTRGDRQPAFSPSGKFVALTNAAKIYVTNRDGSGRRLLTSGYHPDWQPLP